MLGLLRGRPRYGLELVECLSSLGVKSGSIYPLLARIRREGKVESEWVADGVGHPRKYYSLTLLGARTYEAKRHAWSSFSSALQALLEDSEDVEVAK
ncbi:MAG: PadR family transcriptional regulator [Myxococcota bacterium]